MPLVWPMDFLRRRRARSPGPRRSVRHARPAGWSHRPCNLV